MIMAVRVVLILLLLLGCVVAGFGIMWLTVHVAALFGFLFYVLVALFIFGIYRIYRKSAV